ncbi:MAG: ribonucleoside-diphosphate reductase subunit alpha [Proteobacteria bacterium]|nr:ribonucleoside-diphosphate reductase subunit alpha [Pseudomonadota bacterium]
MSLHTNSSSVTHGDNEANGVGRDRSLFIRKRNGTREELNAVKLSQSIASLCHGLHDVDVDRILDKVINGLYDGATSEEIDKLVMHTTAMLISEEPEYSRLAARQLHQFIFDELSKLKVKNFSDSVRHGFEVGLLAETTYNFVMEHQEQLNLAIDHRRSELFEYFGIRTVYDRYLLKDPEKRWVFETPQFFFMRVACGLAQSITEAIEFYDLLSSFAYMPSTPTLFNSGTKRPQMSSCYLLDSPNDSLESIYDRYKDVALLSKFAGGIGLAYHRIRAHGSLIRGTNGKSNGIIPFLKTLDSSVSAVNQGGKRKGAACIYLETWHADILDFLQLRDNTGDDQRRTHNLNLANWIPDLFMKRVENDGIWSLFDPSDVPHFVDIFGDEFEAAYLAAEREGLSRSQVSARELYAAMMKSLAQTGNGWMTFKDASNRKCNQTGKNPANVVHLSNLCTEIIEVTSQSETAVCNLGSINLANYVKDNEIDYVKLRENAQILQQSCLLAKQYGAHASFAETRTADGILQFDLWNIEPKDKARWDVLRQDIKTYGLRNSLLIAIAPTATIASICGAYECIEPQISNLFKRETLSGEFIQINSYLVRTLKELGLWNESIQTKIKLAEGSIQNIEEIPDLVKAIFRTAWEIPQKSLVDMGADRGAYIDQSQSLNLFSESPTIGKLSSMYNYAWKKGLKTTYYLRSRPATKINKTTVQTPVQNSAIDAIACSLENPDACESCQ